MKWDSSLVWVRLCAFRGRLFDVLDSRYQSSRVRMWFQTGDSPGHRLSIWHHPLDSCLTHLQIRYQLPILRSLLRKLSLMKRLSFPQSYPSYQLESSSVMLSGCKPRPSNGLCGCSCRNARMLLHWIGFVCKIRSGGSWACHPHSYVRQCSLCSSMPSCAHLTIPFLYFLRPTSIHTCASALCTPSCRAALTQRSFSFILYVQHPRHLTPQVCYSFLFIHPCIHSSPRYNHTSIMYPHLHHPSIHHVSIHPSVHPMHGLTSPPPVSPHTYARTHTYMCSMHASMYPFLC